MLRGTACFAVAHAVLLHGQRDALFTQPDGEATGSNMVREKLILQLNFKCIKYLKHYFFKMAKNPSSSREATTLLRCTGPAALPGHPKRCRLADPQHTTPQHTILITDGFI